MENSTTLTQKRSFDRYFKYGADRGKEGNGLKRRQERTRKLKPHNYPRLKKKGWYTNLLSALLAEDIGDGKYAINLNKRPLNGAIFEAQILKRYETKGSEPGKEHTDKLQELFADLTHASNELADVNNQIKELGEDVDTPEELTKLEELYTKNFADARNALSKQNAIANNFVNIQRMYQIFKTKSIKLRVLASSKGAEGTFDCLCEPAFRK